MSAKNERPRLTREEAAPLVGAVCGMLDALNVEYHLAGSWRRGSETVGDLDVLIVGEPVDAFELPLAYSRRGPKTCSGDYAPPEGGLLQVDMWSVEEPVQLGAFLWFATGPKELNIAMRASAIKRGLMLSQYGVFRKDDGSRVDDGTEAGVAEAIGWRWLEPAERSDRKNWR